MRHPTSALLCSLLTLGACNGNAAPSTEQQAPAKVVRGVDTKRIPVPNHGPEIMEGNVDKAVMVTTKGKFEAEFHDKVRHFVHFSPGENAATYVEQTQAARVMLTAAESDSGYPRLEVRLSGIRLDKVPLPVRFPLAAADEKKLAKAGAIVGDGKPTLEVRYLIDGARSWSSLAETAAEPNPAEGAEPVVTALTLESFEGKVLSGTLAARLGPKVRDMGEIIEVKPSKFEIELRLRGVEPGAEDESAP